MIAILLYGSESWCLTEVLFHRLRLFHNQCVRAMKRVNRTHSRQHRISDEDLRRQMGVRTIDEYITRRQLSWAGTVARMSFDRLPRKMLSSWVFTPRPPGAPQFTYARGLHKALAKAQIPRDSWHAQAQDRASWRLPIGQDSTPSV